ncbi:MAG: HAMP domain-containing histidine kinase [Oscillospiraceae bacterium]|nr:HAMP domain-containing histidine kinase [Oscillospiraceae bacterium]
MFSVFGRIGRSLGDLSDGINTAVAARLKSERMKTELITNVSHDLRTPLTGLIAYADLLQTEGLDSEKAPEYLDVLTQKANRLKTLTDDLFEASKAASGNVSVQLETLDLSALARQVLGELDERIGQSGLDFRLTLPEPVTARGDGRLMWRVMENLLDNAMKYSLPGSRVYLELDASGPQAVLTLKNISRHPLSKDPWELTERFTRGDESRAGEGSGLGLSIVKSFMDAQGGRLELTADGDLFKAGVWLPKA